MLLHKAALLHESFVAAHCQVSAPETRLLAPETELPKRLPCPVPTVERRAFGWIGASFVLFADWHSDPAEAAWAAEKYNSTR